MLSGFFKINIVVWYQPFGKFGNMLTDKEHCGFCNVTADRSLVSKCSVQLQLWSVGYSY